jgi:dienelactone hydrolase
MRPLETLVLTVSCAAAARMFWTFTPDWLRVSAGLAAIATAFQLSLNGYRWQMLPAYFATALILLASAWPVTPWLRIWAAVAALACLSTSGILCSLLPVFDFPTPTGAYPVGTMTLHLVDSSRHEAFSSDPAAHRELMVKLWYPAAAPGPGGPYITPAATTLRNAHLALVRTHAVESAAFANQMTAWPVLIFAPSWNGGKEQNTFQAEELASHGFIVAGMDHPYGSKATVFPDGRIIRTRLYSWLDLSSDEALSRSQSLVEGQLRIRSDDAIFVLDSLLQMGRQSGGWLEGKVDPSRVGIFGHSFGGAVAAQVCWLDRRFRAGINMDGSMFGEVAASGISQAFFFMTDDTPSPSLDGPEPSPGVRRRNATVVERDLRLINKSLDAHGGYQLTIRGTYHMNFSDFPLFCRLKRLTGAGPIDPNQAMRIINAYSLAFFRQHLNGSHEALLDGTSQPYLEAAFHGWQGHEH